MTTIELTAYEICYLFFVPLIFGLLLGLWIGDKFGFAEGWEERRKVEKINGSNFERKELWNYQ